MGPTWMNDPPGSKGARFPVENGTFVARGGPCWGEDRTLGPAAG